MASRGLDIQTAKGQKAPPKKGNKTTTYAITWKDNDIFAKDDRTHTQYAKDYEEVKRCLTWLETYVPHFVLLKIEIYDSPLHQLIAE